MVVLKKYTICKVISMIITTTDFNCILFKKSVVRCCLSCVKKLNSCTLKQLYYLTCISSYTTHSLKIVKSCPFAT